MASIRREKSGRYTIVVRGIDRRQKTIRLETRNRAHAETAAEMIQSLRWSSADGDDPGPNVRRWLASKIVTPRVRRLLVNAQLLEPSASETAELESDTAASTHTLEQLTDRFLASVETKNDVTLKTYGKVINNLHRYFGKRKLIERITEQDAVEFRAWMLREGSHYKDADGNHKPLSAYTVGRRSTTVKQIFKVAVRAKWLDSDPFAVLSSGGKKDASRDVYMPPETIKAIIDAASTWEWRCIVALNGYAGLRGPSEILTLRWANVWFDRGQCGEMLVESPKTQHHEGMESRIVPIFPLLEPYLREAESEAQRIADEESRVVEFVIDSYRGEWRKNLNRMYDKLTKRANLGKLPKPYVNARGSRESDLLASGLFDAKQLADWWGHSVQEQQRSYLKFSKLRSNEGLQSLVDAQAAKGLEALREKKVPACDKR